MRVPAAASPCHGRMRPGHTLRPPPLLGPEPVVAHAAAYRAWADQHAVPFDATTDRARTPVTEHIARHGAYAITCPGGILVCRR